MAEIYLDNSASTRPYPEVIDFMATILDRNYGNPSSLHGKGVEAEKLLEEARRRIASFFNEREEEIYFTSGGTEANNLAIKGAALRNKNRGNHLITSQVEHPSVLNCFRYLEEKEGFKVDYLPVDSTGLVNPEQVREHVNENTVLVSIMHVNNEVGTIQPLEEIGPLVKTGNPSALFHVDAVQSFARMHLDITAWQADLVSCSAHKIHGPRGSGCLWVKKGTLLQPLFHGGGQEKELRPGTENVPAAAGFGLAARLTGESRQRKAAATGSLKLSFYQALEKSGIEFYVNGPSPEDGAVHIINLSFPGLPSEVLLHSLEERGIFASAGSACHSRKPEPSHILQALQINDDKLYSALRFSLSCYNSEQEMEFAAARTVEAYRELQSMFKKNLTGQHQEGHMNASKNTGPLR